jgi:anti-sigma factor RsiW
VPAIRREPCSDAFPLRSRRPCPRSEGNAQAPRVIEVILGAGAGNLRMLGAIHVEQVVSLPKPTHARLDDIQNSAHIMAPRVNVEKLIVLS